METTDDDERNARFDRALLDAYDRWAAIGYRATRFRQMLGRHGGVETARRLLRIRGVSRGFEQLRDAKKLTDTVEFILLGPEFAPLFSPEERELARRRLLENGLRARQLP